MTKVPQETIEWSFDYNLHLSQSLFYYNTSDQLLMLNYKNLYLLRIYLVSLGFNTELTLHTYNKI